MKIAHTIAFILVVVGALNWGLVGIGEWNLVELLLGRWEILERIVYILVGVSAVYVVATHKKDCKNCESSGSAPQV